MYDFADNALHNILVHCMLRYGPWEDHFKGLIWSKRSERLKAHGALVYTRIFIFISSVSNNLIDTLSFLLKLRSRRFQAYYLRIKFKLRKNLFTQFNQFVLQNKRFCANGSQVEINRRTYILSWNSINKFICLTAIQIQLRA